mmetsp:Transcript_922/g.2150  ORF Transcript_922/g.2150 Transcript_922/m.2150 type:complete len:94 (+) Transcript_922:1-282(+)
MLETSCLLCKSLNVMETWLTQRQYLAGDEPSIADLSATCELAQLQLVDFDLAAWPKVKALYSKIYSWPEVVEVHHILNKVLAKRAETAKNPSK